MGRTRARPDRHRQSPATTFLLFADQDARHAVGRPMPSLISLTSLLRCVRGYAPFALTYGASVLFATTTHSVAVILEG